MPFPANTGVGPGGATFTPRWAIIPKTTAKTFQINKASVSSWAMIQELGPELGCDIGPDSDISGMWVEHSFTDPRYTDLGHFQGQDAPFIYENKTDTGIPFQVPWSLNHKGWTQNYIQTEFDEKGYRRFNDQKFQGDIRVIEFMLRMQYQFLGLPGTTLGQGQYHPAERTWDTRGIIPVLTNTLPYYTINRALYGGRLNSYNLTGPVAPNTTIAAGSLYDWIEFVRDQIGQRGEYEPWLILTNRASKTLFRSEMMNVHTGGTGTHFITAQQTLDQPRFRWNEINYQVYDDNLLVVFDRHIPGNGPGAANNMLAFLNLQFYERKWYPGMYWNEPYEVAGSEYNLFTTFYSIWAWYYQTLFNPQAHGLCTNITMPAVL